MGNELIKNLKYICKCILDVIYSDNKGCVICNEYTKEGKHLCITCSDKIRVCDNSFYIIEENIKLQCYSSAYYSNILKQLVLNLKYKSDFKSGEVLAKYMLETIEKSKIKFDVITYIPLTRDVARKRGYNQSKYLAIFIGKYLNKDVVDVLTKCKVTKDQIGLNKEQRWKNLKDSFRCIDSKKIKNKSILIVDDVITTGATGFHCTKELMRCGAENVIVLSAAKSHL